MPDLSAVTAALLQDYALGRTVDTALSATISTAVPLLKNLYFILFPGFFCGETGVSFCACVSRRILEAQRQLEEILLPLLHQNEARCQVICDGFWDSVPDIRRLLQLDLQAFLAGDPAAADEAEILAAYPGFYAITVYRLAHTLALLGAPLLPRLLSEIAHSRTGIDIHPDAVIGPAFFIDHGTGVVIGQTAAIGAGVKLYQGVTLGALSTRRGRALQNKKRHPTVEDGVTIYANATILGGETVIGKGATVGANAFVTASVPAEKAVIGHWPDP